MLKIEDGKRTIGLLDYTHKGFGRKKVNWCYNNQTKMTFRNPQDNSVYINILRILKSDGPQTTNQLCRFSGKQMLTSMRSAGMIDYKTKSHTWFITNIGKNYLKIAEYYIQNKLEINYITKYFE